MKIRTGFVSNSSSQSFVIRGIKIDTKELAERLSKKSPEAWKKACKTYKTYDPNNIQDLVEAIWSYGMQTKKTDKLDCQGAKYFFDESDTFDESFVIGIELADLEDGQVAELPEPDDEAVKDVIEKHTGIRPEKVATFIQYISNDNF